MCSSPVPVDFNLVFFAHDRWFLIVLNAFEASNWLVQNNIDLLKFYMICWLFFITSIDWKSFIWICIRYWPSVTTLLQTMEPVIQLFYSICEESIIISLTGNWPLVNPNGYITAVWIGLQLWPHQMVYFSRGARNRAGTGPCMARSKVS